MKIPRWNIGIVGGGPGGLFTAYLLEQYHSTPLNITIFESTNRLGGKLLTERFSSSDIHYEAGAAEFYDYSVIDEDPLRELIEQFGLRTQSMGGASIVRGKTVLGTIEDAQDNLGEVTLQEFLRFNNRAKSEVSPRQFYDSTSTSHINAWGTSLQDERFNHVLDQLANTTNNYIQQYIHSDLATEPSQTSHRYGLDNYLMNDPAYMQLYSITGGNDLLIDAVACRLSADVRLNANVTAIKKGVGNTLELSWKATGGSKSEGFDAVVIALPIKPLKKLEFPDSDLASAMQSHIAHHDHPADYLRITILFEKPFWKSWLHDSYCMLDAFDGCCLYDESSRIPEANHGVLGWLLGGAAAQKMAEYSDEELIPAAINSLPFQRDEAKELFREAKIHRWLGAVSAQPGGFQQRQNDAKHCPDIAACPHLLVVGDYLFDSTLNGVLDSADYAAGWITTMAAAKHRFEMNRDIPHNFQGTAQKGRDKAVTHSFRGGHVEEVHFPSISSEKGIEFLKISTDDPAEDHLNECFAWVAKGQSCGKPIVLELYGTLVLWTPIRMVLVTAPRHFEKAQQSILDFTKTALEIGVIEDSLPLHWKHYENDLPTGFSFYNSDKESASALANQYKQVMSLAGKLSRLSPHIHLAPEHPPTLAGQIGERLRDRSRLIDREEFVSEQLEIMIRLYETTGQRVSEYTLAQREYVLIWSIVFLLTAEIVLLLVDLLSTAGN